jgi:acyl transferase domain-containing protein
MSDQSTMSGLETAVAVVGMGVRFPDAPTPERFWANLRDGVESVRRFTDEQLLAAGVPESLINHPAYVKAGVVVDGFDTWDAPFFGFNPRDAEIMDPQHRIFLECVWEAMERAGHDPARFPGAIGVFAGSGMHSYMMNHLNPNKELMDSVGFFLVRHTGNDKDFVATRASYTFDLKGPSLNIQTACSTSLVAIHMAVQHLLSGECDMALAGGVTMELPHGVGYLYQEGEILSPDGHCRPFDADSMGTVFGSGGGVVALRRLADAMADGDHIHAIIRGSAVNNDGSGKVSFLAPSVDGQAQAIAEALAIAGVDAGTVELLESHGTGTPIGDPIEVTALTQAFRTTTQRTGYCALGSVKSNIGHTDTAAGVAGFVKAVLALEHRQIPPTLHYKAPNPAIDFGNSPFYVNPDLREWPSDGVRRAGISSLGVGGTNAHVVIEEAPPTPPGGTSREHQLLVLSARTPTALDAATANLADYLREHPAADLADVAFTLKAGRRAFAERRTLVCRSVDEAAELLETPGSDRVLTATASDRSPSVVFMFAGGGAQYPDMGRGLYETEPVFREAVDECLRLARPHLDRDLRPLLFPDSEAAKAAAAPELERPSLALPALFTIQYAQARLWESWGVEPAAMIGHSMGEYTAACLAGVFSLEAALGVVALRGRLFETIPEGGMLSVPLPPAELELFLTDDLSIAAINGPELCVASGPNDALARLEAVLAERDVECRRIRISVAAHSSMLEPILEPFGEYLRGVKLNPPTRPVVSNLSGAWLREDEATNPDYWVQHLRRTVRFSEGLQLVLDEPDRVLLEVGAGRTLATLGRIHPARAAAQPVLNSLRHPDELDHDQAFMVGVLGQLWLAGVDLDWAGFYGDERRRRVPLPTYPFERRRHFIEAPAQSLAAAPDQGRRADVGDWFYEPIWRRAAVPAPSPQATGRVLAFIRPDGPGAALVEGLRADGLDVVTAVPGHDFSREGTDRFALRPDSPEDYGRLVAALRGAGGFPDRVLHGWALDGAADAAAARSNGFFSLLHLAQAMGEADVTARMVVVTAGAQQVGGEAVPEPAGALTLGPARVIPHEYPGVLCHVVDLDPVALSGANASRTAARLRAEFDAPPTDDLVAYRGAQRFAPSVESVRLSAADGRPLLVKENGVYLVTGGLGGLGLEIARDLARRAPVRLVLVGRSPLPDRSEWDALLASLPQGHALRERITAVRQIEEFGADVLVCSADVTSLPDMRAAVAAAERAFGAVDGVIHAAGVLDDGLIQLKTRDQAERVLAAKVDGTLVLDELFRGRPLDFMVLFSSVSAVAGLVGQVDYTAANSFLDAFAHHRVARDGSPTLSIGWGAWREVGMTAALAAGQARAPADQPLDIRHPLLRSGVRKPDGEEVFTGELSPDRDWILAEHRLREGDPLIPGTGYLELARAAFDVEPGEGPIEVRDVFFMSPFSVPDGASRRLRVELSRGNGTGDFVVLGQVNGNGEWEEHVRGSVTRAAAAEPQRHDPRAIAERCSLRTEEPDGSHDYLQFGPRWGNVRRIHYGQLEALAELELPARFAGDLEQYRLHPALLDMATGGVQNLIEGFDSHDDFYVPIEYGLVRLHRPMPARMFSHIRHRPTDDGSAEVARFDITLMDEDGAEVAEIRDFTMKRVTAEALKRPPAPGGAVRRDDDAGEVAIDLSEAISPEEGADAFARLLDAPVRHPHLLVSPHDLKASLQEWRAPATVRRRDAAAEAPEDPGLREDLERIRGVLEQLDAVAEAVAVAKKGRGGERRLLGYVAYAPGESATVSELRRHAKKNLPSHLVPGNFLDVDEFPRTAAGEVDVAQLPDPFAPVDDHVPPRTETEKRIAAIWTEVLGVDRVGIHDNFFDIGGHSLLGVRVITRIHRELGARLDQATMVLQTLEQIAARCDRSETEAVAATN